MLTDAGGAENVLAGSPRGGRVPGRQGGGGIDDCERVSIAIGGRLPGVAEDEIVDYQVAGIEQADFLAVVVEGIGVDTGDVDAGSVAGGEGGLVLDDDNGCAGREIDVSEGEEDAA